MQAVAKLIRSENNPPDLTLYVTISLGTGPGTMTGIFFSRSYNSEMPWDLILYLRGWTANALPIDKFWSDPKQPQRLLRQKVNNSGKNLVFVVPTLGAKSEAGSLVKPGGADAYLDQVIDSFRKYQQRKMVKLRDGDKEVEFDVLGVTASDDDDDDSTPPELESLVDTVILAAHSGGGTRMAQIVKYLKRYQEKVAECWGFDCTYVSSDAQDMASWAKAHHDAKLFYHYIPGSPTEQVALDMKRFSAPATNLTLLPTAKGVVHDWVPITYFETR